MKANLEKLRERVASCRDEIVRALSSLVAIPSVEAEATEKGPFGDAVADALSLSLEMAKEAGADETVNRAAYAYADFGAVREGEPYIGIFSHVDVVPAGDGWQRCEPFTPTLDGDVLYGRGAEDNKSGAVSALYALRALRESGQTLNHPVRVFFGANEESGMEDIHAFLADTPHLPAVSLVPDAEFPFSVGEKSICRFYVKTPTVKDVLDISGGMALNVVCASARAKLVYRESLLSELSDKVRFREGYHLSYDKEGIVIETVGVPAHASRPEGSKNAFKILASLLAGCRSLDPRDREVFRLITLSMQDDYGTALGIAHTDSRFGRLTAANGTVAFEEGRVVYSFDVRYGIELSPEALEAKVLARVDSAGQEWSVSIEENKAGFHIDESLPFAERLIELYRAASGDPTAATYRMGGGTYARLLPNAYATGTVASYVGEAPVLPEGHGQIHGKDEYIVIPRLLEATAVIAAMIAECDQALDE